MLNAFWEPFEHSETLKTEGVLGQGFELCQQGQEVLGVTELSPGRRFTGLTADPGSMKRCQGSTKKKQKKKNSEPKSSARL